ncbi:hypothetical protein VCRA2110O318_40042 [Vibrio crassostreae]|nr:hypothetical protein VCRA2117O328_40042 [Vibrio crassostreae]CAK2334970.1 hypothetical protein VCRA2110O318_40042 [Vibrio crassostreae]CAK2503318.1 hypothetical protein VCRA2110O319_50042 [Vibrio crassostreae]CAK2911605.1 hypothetical protein VCRA217O317_30251 [Vibrio crassostreae]
MRSDILLLVALTGVITLFFGFKLNDMEYEMALMKQTHEHQMDMLRMEVTCE